MSSFGIHVFPIMSNKARWNVCGLCFTRSIHAISFLTKMTMKKLKAVVFQISWNGYLCIYNLIRLTLFSTLQNKSVPFESFWHHILQSVIARLFLLVHLSRSIGGFYMNVYNRNGLRFVVIFLLQIIFVSLCNTASLHERDICLYLSEQCGSCPCQSNWAHAIALAS